MRRASAATLMVCLLGAGLLTPAGGSVAFGQRAERLGHKVLVPQSVVSGELVYRPHELGLSGDGTFSMSHIRWLTYGSAVARARARAYVRGCTPDCARGRVTRPKASLRFTNLIPCRGAHVYSRLHFVLHGPVPDGGRHRGSLLLITRSGCRNQ